MTGVLTIDQTQQLLAPIRPNRVLEDPRGNSHVSQQDVTAHLIRVFGFCGFNTELLSTELVFESPTIRDGKPKDGRWDVCYRATMRVIVFDKDHKPVASYEDASCGDAQNLSRHDAHDLALKSAISTAKKRCCINLGDQFGLSLYNKGQMAALVGGTLVLPDGYTEEMERRRMEKEHKDVQEGVPQQESMGTDEIEKNPEPDEKAQERIEKTLGGKVVEEEPPAEVSA